MSSFPVFGPHTLSGDPTKQMGSNQAQRRPTEKVQARIHWILELSQALTYIDLNLPRCTDDKEPNVEKSVRRRSNVVGPVVTCGTRVAIARLLCLGLKV